MYIIFWAIVIIFLFRLNGRVRKIEEILKTGNVPSVAPAVSTAQFVSTPTADISVSSPVPQEPSVPVFVQNREPSWDEALGAWIKEDWLLKLGAFIILLGFGWFVSYAFAHNWIGPLGRVTLGMILGIGILGFGWMRMHLYARQGSVFLGLGTMVVILSAYSAAYVYALIPSRAALGIMFLTSAFLALASVRFKILSLSIVGILIASIAPTTLLINATPTNVELFAYLFAVTLGTVWIVSLTGWRNLTAVSLAMFFLYSLPRLGVTDHETGTLLLFAYAFALLFFITNTVGILKNRDGNIQPDTLTAAANGLVLLMWVMAHASQEWKSLIIIGWMMLFVVAAFAIFAITKRKEPFFVYAGVGVAMLAAATAVELEGAALTIAYIIESAIIPFVAYLVMGNRKIAESLTLLVAGPALLSLSSMAANWSSGIPGEHFFVLLLMSATLFLLGIFFMMIPHENGAEEGTVAQTLFVAGSIYAYILLWLSLHATIADKDTATMICLVIYTLIGLGAYVYGKLGEQKGLSYYGGVLLGFTIAHLLLIDVWNMELSGRIITFFIVGALLMMTAFIGKKKPGAIPQA